ncbi:MAG: preprotein translocase subunit SecG [Acidobacteriia bacterium]|jgi:preprotein translocase subunit SecG|nr:preprotein translocase subunit SecG [Terriglobia bacterium]
MVIVVSAIHVLVSLLLIFIVLIQGGENVDITAAFGGVSQAAFGPRGAITTLQKATWVLAGIFMVTSITLAIWASKSAGGSILQGAPQQSAPQQQAPAPAKK